MLNRNDRYLIIKELIIKSSPETIKQILISIKAYNEGDDIEYRRNELLNYLDEMNESWNKRYTDLTDRQFIHIIDDEKEEEDTNDRIIRIL